MKNTKLIPYPKRIQAALGMDGRHHAVPIMVDDERWNDEENQPYHPRIGSITHGRGHADQMNAEHLAMEIAVRYNSYDALYRAVKNFVTDCDKGLGPSVDRLRSIIASRENV